MSNSRILSTVAAALSNNNNKLLSVENSSIVWANNYALTLAQQAYDQANTSSSNTFYTQGVDASQNTRILAVEANTVYLFGALNQTNTNIELANTQLKAYTDGAISSSVTSANTQLKAYTDGIVTSANTQLKAYTDGQLSANLTYLMGINTSQNTSISALQTLANTDVTSITISSGTYGGTTNVAVVTVAANGRITSISNTLISSGATITDDNTTNATRYLMLGQSTSGSYTVANTSSTKLTYNPSKGEVTANAVVATSGMLVHSNIINANYTLDANNNAVSAGPISVANGVVVTVSSGSIWTVV
jgi:hypothetical protein